MAYGNKEDFMRAIGNFVGDRTDDDALNFVSEMSETYDSVEARGNENAERRVQEVEENWRKKYRDTFLTPKDVPEIEDDATPETKKPLTFEDLFTSEG